MAWHLAQNPTYTLEQKASDSKASGLSIRVTTPGVSADNPTELVLPAKRLNTNYNKFCIDSKDICGLATIPSNQANVADSNIVVCASGKLFKNVYNSSAPTPPYGSIKNYIGLSDVKRGHMHNIETYNYVCNGPCEEMPEGCPI